MCIGCLGCSSGDAPGLREGKIAMRERGGAEMSNPEKTEQKPGEQRKEKPKVGKQKKEMKRGRQAARGPTAF